MPENPGPYSRLYWRFSDEYSDVYDDDRLFAWWMRLLVIADGSHPASGSFPRRITNGVIQKLVDRGLVTLIGANNFRLKGVEGERERRRHEQRNGGIVRAETGERGPDGRWVASSGGPAVVTSDGLQRSSNSKAEQSKDETRREVPPISPMNGVEPYVTLSQEEKEKRREAEREELMARTMARLGVKP